MSSKTMFRVAALTLAVLTAPPGLAQGEADGGREAGLVKGGAAPDAFLIYTGDVIGYLDPCG